jgi:hypothetical protein
MRVAAMLVLLSLGFGPMITAQPSDPDPLMTRTVILENFADPGLPCWLRDRQGGSINVVGEALCMHARTFTGYPTTSSLVMENLVVNNNMLQFTLTHENTAGEAAFTVKNSGDSWYEVQFDATAGQVRFEKWASDHLVHAGIFAAYTMETGVPYVCRIACVENHVFAQISPDGIAWHTLFSFADLETTAPGTISIVARDLKNLTVDDIQVWVVAGSPGDPVPAVVQTTWTDDFADEDTLCWTHEPSGGIVSLSNGALLLRSVSGDTTSSRIHALVARNFCLEATLTLNGINGYASVDMRFTRAGEHDSMFRVILDPTVSRVRLEEHHEGTVTPRGSGSFFLADNAAYDVQLVCLEGWVFVGIRGNGNTLWDNVVTHYGTTVFPTGGFRFNAVDSKELRIGNVVLKAVARFF